MVFIKGITFSYFFFFIINCKYHKSKAVSGLLPHYCRLLASHSIHLWIHSFNKHHFWFGQPFFKPFFKTHWSKSEAIKNPKPNRNKSNNICPALCISGLMRFIRTDGHACPLNWLAGRSQENKVQKLSNTRVEKLTNVDFNANFIDNSNTEWLMVIFYFYGKENQPNSQQASQSRVV